MKIKLLFILLVSSLMGLKISAQTDTENKTNSVSDVGLLEEPKFIETGNRKLDKKLFAKKMDEYCKQKSQALVVVKENDNVEKVQSDKVELPNDFPVLIKTGNLELDNENYIKAKEKWMMDHQDEINKQ